MYKKENPKFSKLILRIIYSYYVDLILFINLFFNKKNNILKVFYGGAYSGDSGGTLVKIKRLNNYFKEKKIGFNILYLLSNSIYHHHFILKNFKKNLPIVHNQNGVFYSAWYSGDWVKQNRRMFKQLNLADYVFYQSEFCKFSSDKFLGKRKNNYEILYNACDLNKFKPLKKNKKINIKKKIEILMTGTYRSYMLPGLISSIKSVTLLKKKINVKLNIFGHMDKKLKLTIVDFIKKNELEKNVSIFGPYTQSEAPNIYKKNDIYFFMVHNAPCPNALIEAIASGLPIVYLDSGASKEIVGKGGIGIKSELSWTKFKNISPKLIYNSIIKILKNYNYYSKESRKRAIKNHDIKNWIKRHKDIFTNLIPS
ncbi:MAG: glycosyltransferase [Pelagibacteraceae bacterium TMED124]|nr:hypothetical protein [Candidatus Neomarinimicrobiota bacterium]RPG17194.1 MAG: glycosyltransferase [Pelagibacteraceae bacterium TMED124]|tara:strand:+ start:1159 stop:2262 length:1104 start_codon:yes stop_codon:yes gene_type:complete